MPDFGVILDRPRTVLAVCAAAGLLLGVSAGSGMATQPVQRGHSLADLIPPSFDSRQMERRDISPNAPTSYRQVATSDGSLVFADAGKFGRSDEAFVEPAAARPVPIVAVPAAPAPADTVSVETPRPVAEPALAVFALPPEDAEPEAVVAKAGASTVVSGPKVIDVAEALAALDPNS